MRFIAIDFETANTDRSSACAIGMVVVEDGGIIDKRYHLIKPSDPYFDPFNVSIHGITEEDVEDEPGFNELWPSIRDYFGNRIVIAHNASFDMSVLRHVLDEYGIPYPEIPYSCTRVISKKMWSMLPSHSLDVVADHLSIEFVHHDAIEDASACARIAIRACEEAGAGSMDELARMLEFPNGCLFPGGYRPAKLNLPKSYELKPKEIIPSGDRQDPAHTFFGKTMVFTGALRQFKRDEAKKTVQRLGGRVSSSVSKQTDYVVAGADPGSKYDKAKKLGVTILTEEKFRELAEPHL